MTHASEPAPAAASTVTGPRCCNSKQTAALKQVFLVSLTNTLPEALSVIAFTVLMKSIIQPTSKAWCNTELSHLFLNALFYQLSSGAMAYMVTIQVFCFCLSACIIGIWIRSSACRPRSASTNCVPNNVRWQRTPCTKHFLFCISFLNN